MTLTKDERNVIRVQHANRFGECSSCLTVGRYSEETVVWPCWAIKYVDALDALDALDAEKARDVYCGECTDVAENRSNCDYAHLSYTTHPSKREQ